MKDSLNIEKKIYSNISGNSNKNDIARAKKIYDEFVENMNQSDFCNSERRYIAELTYVERLIRYYEEKKCPTLLSEMKKRKLEILEKLKNEFGITIEN